MKEDKALPDDLRCKRTDGRQWRCRRRVMENKKLCEIHHLQGRHRQHKEKVPESLKIKRKKHNQDSELQNQEISARKRGKEGIPRLAKRSRNVDVSEALDDALRKMKLKRGDLQLELIRGFLQRQVEKKKEKELKKNGQKDTEMMRELPNGLMAISPALSQQNLNIPNASCNVKLGIDPSLIPRRCFRSKNIEPVPISTMQIIPCARNVAKLRKRKRNKCHWCRKSSYRTLIKCSSCKKEYFCTDCIMERVYVIEEQVKIACPVCCRTCSCRSCLRNQSKDDEHKDLLRNENRADKIQQLVYLIYMLLPVLEKINREQGIELGLEAKLKGKTISEVQVQQAEFSRNKPCCCNNCQISVVDFHRRCQNCSYKLCLSCSESFRGSLSGSMKASLSKCQNRSKVCSSGDKLLSKVKQISSSRQDCGGRYLTSPTLSPKWKVCDDDGNMICPPMAFGGCGDGFLDLRCIFPYSWTRELEISAEKMVCSFDFSESLDGSSSCSLCKGMDDKAGESKLLQGAASRGDSNDNFLYYPAVQDLQDETLDHFQKHWGKGHPVIVRRVLKSTPEISWDPVVMFCTYLEKSSSRSRNDKEATNATNCLDWCEIEICSKQIFMGSLEGRSHANMRYEVLKLRVWLSSYLFQEQFPHHHAEIIRTLPLQEYMNPVSGLFNLAVNLPQDTAKPDLGPCLYISFGSPEDLMQAEFLTKLCYDSHDVVNILVHTTDVPVSSEQLTNIKNLMKQYNAQDNLTRIATDQKMENEGEEKSSVLSDNTEESGLQDMIEQVLPLDNGVANVSLFTGVSHNNACSSSVKEANMSRSDGHNSESDSEASILCSGFIQSSEELDDQNCFQDHTKGSCCSWEKPAADSCGAKWDIFRREDVPKLLEYLSRHSKEFSPTHCLPKHVVHAILDQSFYLDATHKIRLKEEYNIEPWTFEQHLGEAVIIPAGCPYQIRKLK
ncbi:hypothetical protein U1Q18_009055, partial [Sarracenia purpurea var. burkii]